MRRLKQMRKIELMTYANLRYGTKLTLPHLADMSRDQVLTWLSEQGAL